MKNSVRDVAERVGVSVPAVYQALRGTGRLSSQTRRKIIDAADQLGVRPNRTAANMKRGRHSAYGLLLHNWQAFPKHYLFALVSESRKRGVFLIVEYTPVDEAPRLIEEDCVDGVLLFEPVATPFHEDLKRFGIPVVHVNANTRFEPNCITYDERAAVRSAMAHFKANGWNRTALVLPQPAGDAAKHYSLSDREDEYLAVMTERGDPPVIIRSFFRHAREDQLRRLIEHFEPNPQIDSLLLYSDSMTNLAYSVVRRMGKEPGRDIGVIGFNNTGRSIDAMPASSALGVPSDVLAKTAMDSLEGAVKKGTAKPVVLQYTLYARSSTERSSPA